MMLFREDIPAFIQSSQYLQSLLSEGSWPAEGLEVPNDCVKGDLTVSNDAELLQLLTTLRYWLVPEVAENVPDLPRYALAPTVPNDFASIAAAFATDLPFIAELLAILHAEDKVAQAALFGRFNIVILLCEELSLPVSEAAGLSAAQHGHIDCLKYLLSRGLQLSSSIYKCACEHAQLACVQYLTECDDQWAPFASQYAVKSGSLECMKYTITLNKKFSELRDAPRLLQLLAAEGHLKCIQGLVRDLGWISEEGTVWMMRGAAHAGHMNILQFGVQRPFPRARLQEVMLMAVSGGRVDCISYIHSQGCPYHVIHMMRAATEGHLFIMKFLRNDGCPWDAKTCHAAAAAGHLDCLKYAHEHGCPWRNENFANSADVISVVAARAPTVDCLRYVVSQGALLYQHCAYSALTSKCLSTLQFLHMHHITWDEKHMSQVAESGWLEGLIYLHEIGTSWDTNTTDGAARCGNTELLLFALQRGCPYNDYVLAVARSLGGAHAQECVRFMEQQMKARADADD